MDTMSPGEAPLDGIKVLDMTRLLPGPLCGQFLADLGAEVVKIEDTQAGDYIRDSVRDLVNRGKKGLSVNLKTEEGRRVFLDLVGESDVVLESFRPGTMARLGLGYDQLAAHNPRLVYCAISGFGQAGPYSLAAGHDINFQALTGILHQTGTPDAQAIPGFLIGDIAGGTLSAVSGILAALLRAQRTGRGGVIDVSMADSLLALSVLPIAVANEGGGSPARGAGIHTGGTAHYNVYQTRDGRYLAVGAQEKKFWRIFCDVIGCPDLGSAHTQDINASLNLKEQVQAVIRQRDLSEWLNAFEGHDCCVSPVLSTKEALEDRHFRARGAVWLQDGAYRVGLPFGLSGLSMDRDRLSPAQGEHTREILAGLGYSEGDVEWMVRADVVAVPKEKP